MKNFEDVICEIAKQDTTMYKMGMEHGKGEKMLIADFLKKISRQNLDPNKTFIEVKFCE